MNVGEKPLVSVIVPSYNYQNYIKDALMSIYNQIYKTIELIIVDDNSKDESCDIIEELVNDKGFLKRFDNKVTFIKHQVNQGAHESINEGIKRASGAYITILNADDLFESNRINELISNILKAKGQFIFSSIKVINEFGLDIGTTSDQAASFIQTQKSIKSFPTVGWSLIPHNTTISTGNMLFSKEIFNQLNGFRNLKYCHDWDFALRALLLTEPIYIDTTSYLYRLHGKNTFLNLNDVVDREVKTVLGKYFKECRTGKVENKLAPSPRNWNNDFFELLKNSSMIKFWTFSKSISNIILQWKQTRLDKKE